MGTSGAARLLAQGTIANSRVDLGVAGKVLGARRGRFAGREREIGGGEGNCWALCGWLRLAAGCFGQIAGWCGWERLEWRFVSCWRGSAAAGEVGRLQIFSRSGRGALTDERVWGYAERHREPTLSLKVIAGGAGSGRRKSVNGTRQRWTRGLPLSNCTPSFMKVYVISTKPGCNLLQFLVGRKEVLQARSASL